MWIMAVYQLFLNEIDDPGNMNSSKHYSEKKTGIFAYRKLRSPRYQWTANTLIGVLNLQRKELER